MVKQLFIAGILLSIIIATHIAMVWPDDFLHVYFCDVGQGDAILISHRFTQILIDAGPNESVRTCLNYTIPFWDRTIEIVIATHADADHIGGMPSVFAQYDADLILLPALSKETSDFEALQQAVQTKIENGSQAYIGRQGQFLRISEHITGKIIWPPIKNSEQLLTNYSRSETTLSDTNSLENDQEMSQNDLSISLLLTFNQVSYLFTGDLELAGETALLSHGLIQDVDVIKVGHHGSNSSSHRDLLGKSQPEVAVISVGAMNTFGHPSPEVITRLTEVGATILRTDTSGTLDVRTDGERIILP